MKFRHYGAILLLSLSCGASANPWETGTLQNLRGIQVFQVFGSLCDYGQDIFDYNNQAFKDKRVDFISSMSGGGGAISEVIDSYKGDRPLYMLEFKCDYELSGDSKTAFIVNSVELIGAVSGMPSTVTIYRDSSLLVVPSENWKSAGLASAKKLIDNLVKNLVSK